MKNKSIEIKACSLCLTLADTVLTNEIFLLERIRFRNESDEVVDEKNNFFENRRAVLGFSLLIVLDVVLICNSFSVTFTIYTFQLIASICLTNNKRLAPLHEKMHG